MVANVVSDQDGILGVVYKMQTKLFVFSLSEKRGVRKEEEACKSKHISSSMHQMM
jgi:hypothetical protein